MKTIKIVTLAIILIVLGGALYMNPLLPIITGYAAKNLSSGIFVANRSQESMEETDLNFSFIAMVKNSIDKNNRRVKSTFLWDRSTSVEIDGFGCTLVNDYSIEEIKNRNYKLIPALPETPDTIGWPMGNSITDTIPAGINIDKLNRALDRAFLDTLPFKGTFAVAVVYKNQLLAERYKQGLNQENKFLSWSMAKSFTNALVGILVKNGKLNVDEPMKIKEWQADERRKITLSQLMHMNSGLEWNEDYGNNSDVNIMLHKEGDMGRYALEKPLEYTPDSVWEYSSGATNIVSWYIRETIDNDEEYYAFPRKALFNKIGMKSAVFEVDASGTFVGSSYLYATMQDYARFGLLFLNEGNWMGEQILPEYWLDFTRSEAKGSEGQYGAFFWLNKSGKDYPDVPRDMYCCRGHDGQYIYIIPSKELVVVRTGFSKKGEFDYNQFLAALVESVD